MENATEVVQDVQDDVVVQQDDAGFEAGFAEARGEEPPVQQEVPETQAQPTEQPEVAEPEEPAQEEMLIAGLTEAQVKELLVKAGQVDELNARIEKAFGKFGEVQRNLQALQQQRASGVKLSAESFKRLGEQFPEIATDLAADLSEALGSLPQSEAFDPSSLETMVADRLSAKEREIAEAMEKRWLKRQHPTWEQDIQSPDFSLWGKTQLQPDEWNALLSSNDADEISRGLDNYKAWRETASKTKESKQKRLESAITPRGNAAGPSVVSEQDAFEQAVKDALSKRLY